MRRPGGKFRRITTVSILASVGNISILASQRTCGNGMKLRIVSGGDSLFVAMAISVMVIMTLTSVVVVVVFMARVWSMSSVGVSMVDSDWQIVMVRSRMVSVIHLGVMSISLVTVAMTVMMTVSMSIMRIMIVHMEGSVILVTVVVVVAAMMVVRQCDTAIFTGFTIVLMAVWTVTTVRSMLAVFSAISALVWRFMMVMNVTITIMMMRMIVSMVMTVVMAVVVMTMTIVTMSVTVVTVAVSVTIVTVSVAVMMVTMTIVTVTVVMAVIVMMVMRSMIVTMMRMRFAMHVVMGMLRRQVARKCVSLALFALCSVNFIGAIFRSIASIAIVISTIVVSIVSVARRLHRFNIVWLVMCVRVRRVVRLGVVLSSIRLRRGNGIGGFGGWRSVGWISCINRRRFILVNLGDRFRVWCGILFRGVRYSLVLRVFL